MRMDSVVRTGTRTCEQFQQLHLDAGWCEQDIIAQADAQLSARSKRQGDRCCAVSGYF